MDIAAVFLNIWTLRFIIHGVCSSELQRNRERRQLAAKKVLTWNMNYLAFKLGRENTEEIKLTACNVIQEADIVGLQEASAFYPSIYCTDTDFHSERSGEFVVLAKRNMYKGLEATFVDSRANIFSVLAIPEDSSDYPVFIVNCHFPKGRNVAMRNERLQILEQIRMSTLNSMAEHMLVRDPVIILLGTLNAGTPIEFSYLREFRLTDADEAFSSLLHFDGKDPFTTASGLIVDDVIVRRSRKSIDELHFLEQVFSFSAQDPFRFQREPGNSSFILRLINNWQIAKHTAGQGTQAANLFQCIESFVADRTNKTCPSSWVSSHEVSDHLPLRLKLTLPSLKSIYVGTWNINRVRLEERLNDPAITDKFNKVFGHFDILVLQEVPRSLTRTPNSATKFLIEKFGVTGLIGYDVRFQHGLLLSSKLTLKPGSAPEMTSIKMRPKHQGPGGFYRLAVSDDGNEIMICLVSVHLSKLASWNDVVLAVNHLSAKDYARCNFVAAMGDFQSIKDGVSDITIWTDHNRKVNFNATPEACYHVNAPYKYTRIKSKHRQDYIFVLKMDPPLSLDGCDIIRTGNGTVSTEVEDWYELSEHYPFKVELA